jgi:hypothetical protein
MVAWMVNRKGRGRQYGARIALYGDKTKAGLPKTRDSIPGMGKRVFSFPKHPELLRGSPNSIVDR